MGDEPLDTSAGLWTAVWTLADAWSETPVVREFAATLPRNRPISDRSVGATGLPALLHHLEISIGGLMHPLRFGSRIPVLLSDQMIGGSGLPRFDASDLSSFLQNARRIEEAHRLTLAWLRSSLAGYPMLRAPQLAPGTPLTTDEVTTNFVWHKHELAAGLNLRSSPPNVAELLGADATTRTVLEAAARDLSVQFGKSREWVEFGQSSQALDELAKAELLEARRELKRRLVDERIDEHEVDLALPRLEYRAHTTADVVDALTGRARTYALAFNGVDELLTLVACDVFSELAMYGEPWPVPVTNVEVAAAGKPFVEFECAGAAALFLDVGQVLWLDRSAVYDAVRIQRKTLSLDLVQTSNDRFGARVLRETAQGWPASSPSP